MAGIWFSENNQIGHLFSFAYEDDDNQGFDDYLVQESSNIRTPRSS